MQGERAVTETERTLWRGPPDRSCCLQLREAASQRDPKEGAGETNTLVLLSPHHFIQPPVHVSQPNLFRSQREGSSFMQSMLGNLLGISAVPRLWRVDLRQEIDGPQAEQLESVPSRQILQDEDNSRREKLSPAQIRDKETTYFSFSKSRRPSQLHMCKSQKGSDVNLPIDLFARIHLG